MNVSIVTKSVGTASAAEAVHRRSAMLQELAMRGPFYAAQVDECLNTTMRAVHDRNPAVLQVLDQTTQQVEAHVEREQGQTRRTSSTFAGRIEATEAQLWRNATVLAERGEPSRVYGYIYMAAATYSGVVRLPESYREG